MNSPIQAMLWELWRTSRWELLFRLAWQCGIVLLIYSFSDDFSDPQIMVTRGIVVQVLTFSSIFSMTWLKSLDSEDRGGFSFRLGFTRPVSTIRLVALPLLFSVLAAVGCYLVPATLFRLLVGVPLPLAGLTAIIASAVACCVAATWSPSTRTGKGLATTAVVAGLGFAIFLFHTRHHEPITFVLAIGEPEYFQLAWYEYAGLIAAATLAFIVAVASVEGQRHGDRWLEGRWPTLSKERGLSTYSHSKKTPFSGPFAAQTWYEMRRFGNLLLALAVSFPLIAIGAISTLLWFDPDWQGAPYIALLAVVICPIFYLLIGVESAIGLRYKQGVVQYSAFDATRSLANDQLIAIKLFVIAACSLFGWVCMVATLGMHAVLFGYWPTLVQLGEAVSGHASEVPVYWWIAGVSNAALLYVSNSSTLLAISLWMPLHKRIFIAGIGVLFINILLASWDADNGWALRSFWIGYGYFVAVAIVVCSVVALWKALTAGYLGKRLFGCAFCIWAIYLASSIAVYFKAASAVSIPLPVIALGSAMLLVPLATTAFAPLALASHRHG